MPFYKDNPLLTRKNLVILLLGVVIADIAPFIIHVDQYFIVKALIITFTTLIQVIHTLRGHLKTICRFTISRDIIRIIIGLDIM